MSQVTLILDAIGRNDDGAMGKLLPLVYQELREMAAARMAREAAGHTLQPTALVHEAWLRMVGEGGRNWKSRAYFFAAASESMRRILIEHARRKSRLKHGGGQKRLSIEDLDVAEALPDEKILLVDEALERLKAEDPEAGPFFFFFFFFRFFKWSGIPAHPRDHSPHLPPRGIFWLFFFFYHLTKPLWVNEGW